MKISLEQTEVKDKGDFLARFYLTKEQSKDVSLVCVECRTRHYKTKMKGAKRMYLILEGSGSFIINDKREDAKPYDLFIISDGETYEYSGVMKMMEVNVPATDSSNYENLD